MKLVMVIGFFLSIVAFGSVVVAADVVTPSGFLSPNAGLSVQSLAGASQSSSLSDQGVLNIASLLRLSFAAEEDQGELDNSTILLSVALLVLVFVFGLILSLNQ